MHRFRSGHQRIRQLRIRLLLASLAMFVFLHGNAAAGDDTSLQRIAAHAKARCEAMPADLYWTGLIFNPPDLETGYRRSRCYQELAERLRDLGLCRQARERTSLFFDGSGISPAACTATVAERIRSDQAAARALQETRTITRLALRRNGNGKDVDVHLRLSSGTGISYWLTMAVIGDDGVERLVHADWQPMSRQGAELMLFIEHAPFVRALAGQSLDREATLRVALERKPRNLDELAIYSYLPRGDLRSVMEQRFTYTALERELSKPAR